MKLILLPAIFLLITFTSCTDKNNNQINDELDTKMNKIAEDYVKLVLNVGQYDPGYVDAYYGPDNLKPDSTEKIENNSTAFSQLTADADKLLNQLEDLSNYKANKLEVLRYRFLYKQLLAVKARIFMLTGGTFTFDEETKALYDTEAPVHDEEFFKETINKLSEVLPGKGDVSQRLRLFKEAFIIPKDKLDDVFKAAIDECRKRTLQHIELPRDENFKVEYVNDKPWSGYNWYKGNNYSVIQVNTDLPIYIERAVDLAAHEGYPGHHVYNSLLEQHLVKREGFVEFSVYPLYSPQSLIAEGSANYGIKVAFPGYERIKFEKEVLFPIAGLDSSKADKYYEVLDLVDKLSYAGNEAARNYLNGKWTKEETKNYLKKYSLMNDERAEQRLKFIDKYRSYVINYNVGQDIVKDYINSNGGIAENQIKRWELFKYILSTPQTPSGLKSNK